MPIKPLTPSQIQAILLDMNKVLSRDLPGNVVSKCLSEICFAALVILFLSIMIRFIIDCISNGYSINVLKKYLLSMVLLGVILTPLVYKKLALLYIDLFNAMMEYIGYYRLEEIQGRMLRFFRSYFDDGNAGVKKLFGWLPIRVVPLDTMLAQAAFMLFVISMYELFAIPILLCCLAIGMSPVLIALSPVLSDLKSKMWEMLFGIAIVFPAVFFGISTFLPISIDLVGRLLLQENMMLLTIICLCYCFVIAYTLPMVGYISGMSFLSEMRVIFPATWIEYLFLKPVLFLLSAGKKKGGK
jgi:hypothetical protein